ncbi:MAG TPA: amidohydrolase family protein [Chloroflexota bacterium]|jgi:predicted TIM-barrel fold metal-dependent hydrolase
MKTIDADAHVIETDATWEHLTAAERKHVGKAVSASGDDLWLIDGRAFTRRRNVGLDTPVASQELTDVKARLRHMDELDIDVQVLYPSLFLIPITDNPETEVGLYRSYNRWLADVWAQGDGRLRWAVMAPTRALDEALAEVRWGKEHGACAVFLRGIEGGRFISDPYFFPLFEEAQRLDLPICLHAAGSNFAIHEIAGAEAIHKFKAPVFCAFDSLVFHDVPARFPRLRFGFVETTSQWVPYVIHQLRSRLQRRGRSVSDTLLRDSRFYVTCETHDDLPYVLRYAGEGQIVLGTDYGHADPTTEIDALRHLRERGTLDEALVRKILEDNPRALYSL